MRRFLACFPIALAPACTPSTIVLDGKGEGVDSGGDPERNDTGDTGADSGDTGEDSGGEETGDTDPQPACLDYGVVIETSAYLAYGGTVDGYDGSLGAWGSTSTEDGSLAVNAHSECALTNGATVRGSLYVGGDPSRAYCEEWGVSLTGGVHTLAAAAEMPDVGEPSGLPDEEGELNVAWDETRELSGVHHFDDATLAYGGTLRITGPTVIVVDSFNVQGATVTLDAGATLDVYSRGTVDFAWGTQFNTGGDAAAVRLLMGEEDSVTLAGGAWFTGQLLAPRSPMYVSGSLQGAAAADTLELYWGGALHADRALLCP